MRALGTAVRLKIIVMRANAHQVAAMRAAAEGEGFPHLVDVTITARHDGTRGSLAVRVGDDQLAELFRGPLRDLLPAGTACVTEERFACNCARGNCAIAANGDVYPCLSVPWVAGNVLQQPFIHVWQRSPVFQHIRGLRMIDYPACGPCADKAYCSRSRGAAFNHSGSYTGIDPFVCRSAALVRQLRTSPPGPSR
jgi:radical SAM protein with 4Fe4S-binding SPASM domain